MTIYDYIREIKLTENVEYYNAKSDNKTLKYHARKWFILDEEDTQGRFIEALENKK